MWGKDKIEVSENYDCWKGENWVKIGIYGDVRLRLKLGEIDWKRRVIGRRKMKGDKWN